MRSNGAVVTSALGLHLSSSTTMIVLVVLLSQCRTRGRRAMGNIPFTMAT